MILKCIKLENGWILQKANLMLLINGLWPKSFDYQRRMQQIRCSCQLQSVGPGEVSLLSGHIPLTIQDHTGLGLHCIH